MSTHYSTCGFELTSCQPHVGSSRDDWSPRPCALTTALMHTEWSVPLLVQGWVSCCTCGVFSCSDIRGCAVARTAFVDQPQRVSRVKNKTKKPFSTRVLNTTNRKGKKKRKTSLRAMIFTSRRCIFMCELFENPYICLLKSCMTL